MWSLIDHSCLLMTTLMRCVSGSRFSRWCCGAGWSCSLSWGFAGCADGGVGAQTRICEAIALVLRTWLPPAARCYLPTVAEPRSRGTETLLGPGMLRFTIQHLLVALGGMPGSGLGEFLARGLFCRAWDTGGNLLWCCRRGSLGLLCLKHHVRAHQDAPGVDPLVQMFFSIALQTPLHPTPPFSARYCQICSAHWRRQQEGGLRDVSRGKKSPVLQLWLLSHFPSCSLCW